ncbi:MAG TPA: type II toxin-antitoxin system death-on-curing family toxin [Pyrinomonadaceae bacterium]|nr:type II toxin-antitoxin system death-on-curing family toxin [Pyrinomonadaceae bacterium]
MATEEVQYISYGDAVYTHLELMRLIGEERCGVFDRSLVKSALARPQQAAAYEDADLIRQAATLCFGLIRNHPWIGGNKRTATALLVMFLRLNGVKLAASTKEIVDMVIAVEAGGWNVDAVTLWLRHHCPAIQ